MVPLLQDTFRIKELFAKDIERNINGVVQAGQIDEATRHEELSEYVMTREIEENMVYFYRNYVKSLDQPTTGMGVWISGFFGSGKSHFLKILSYLLDNKTVYGKKPVDYFLDKTTNQQLLEQMNRVASYDTHAILFNIDSKASAKNRPGDEKEMIVEVFLKAFNEYLGYDSSLWIADIERQIAEASDYEAFKRAFEEVDGTRWEDSRGKIKFKRKSFKEALKRIGVEEATAEDLLRSANKEFSISSEEFAKMVAEHCRKQGPKYRLTFLVDEIGQYIGDNRRLMLNLQTVVEDLGKACLGQVWVIVTSQEQIDSVTKLAGYDDFSKIQGRFPTRINLTSSNVDEVIQRRLLEKTAPAADELCRRYEEQEQSLQNLLAFDRNRTVLRSGFRSDGEFASFYPFVPYQIDLLQKVFEKVRNQGEAGKHLAHGERSLLNAIQEVAIALKDEGLDRLARFSQFYDTIKRFLDSSIVSTVYKAQFRDGIEPFDIEVLKVLYLIKGINEIQATVENITTLLIDSVDVIKADLEKQVRQSLARLKKQILIQENADQTFTFLSDDEQEVQREVDRTPVNEANLDDKLGARFFGEVFNKPRVMYKKIPFDYNKQFNQNTRGATTHDLTLQVVTRDMTVDEARLQAAAGKVIMRIPDDQAETFEEPLRRAMKIESYLSLKRSSSVPQQYKTIYDNLAKQQAEFEKQAAEKLKIAAKEAVFFIDGMDYTFSGTVENQIEQAFEKLIANTFPKLTYIEQHVPPNAAKETIADWGRNGLPASTTGDFINHLAFKDIQSFLERSQEVTLKQVYDYFTRKPYGWSEPDIAGIVAGMQHAGRVELIYLNESLEPSSPDYAKRLLGRSEGEKVRIKVKEGMPPRIRKDVIDLLKSVFNHYDSVDTYQDAARVFRSQLEVVDQKASRMYERAGRGDAEYPYPGAEAIGKIRGQIRELLSVFDAKTFVQDVVNAFEDIEEAVEKLEDLGSFYNGKGIDFFDRAVSMMKKHRDNLIAYDGDPEVVTVGREIEGILRDKNPFGRVKDLPALCDRLDARLSELVKQEAEEAVKQIEQLQAAIDQLASGYEQRPEAVDLIRATKTQLSTYREKVPRAESRSTIATYREKAEKDYRHLQEKLSRTVSPEPVVHLSLSGLLPPAGRRLDSEGDIEAFLDELRSHLKTRLKDGKIHLIR